VLAGLQPTVTGLVDDERPAAAVEGRNHFGEEGYSGPRPPVGDDPHRYVFWVFRRLGAAGVGGRASADDLRRALEGKELASALWSACTTADHSPNAQPELDRENHHERLGSCTKKGVVMASQITLTDQEARAFLAARPGQ
jgi:phosphatidylethanolamine-binding protein